MKQSCIAPQDIGAILALPEDDRRRRHLSSCFRCRTLGLAYEEFMNPAKIDEGEDFETADRELASRLSSVLSPKPSRLTLVRQRSSGHRGLYAMAAVLAVCAGLFLARDVAVMGQQPPVSEELRIERGGHGEQVVVQWMQTAAGWELQWSTPVGTDQAMVIYYDAAMNDLSSAMVAPGLTLDQVPDGATYLQVFHLAHGDTVARSPVSVARPGGS